MLSYRKNSKRSSHQSNLGSFAKLSMAAAAAVLAVTQGVRASDTVYEWTGTTSGAWGTSSNWLGNPLGTIPGTTPIVGSTGVTGNWTAISDTGDTAVFNRTSSNTTITVGANVGIRGILFDTAFASGYTIGNGTATDDAYTITFGYIHTSNNVAPIIWDSSTVTTNQTINNPFTFFLNSAETFTVENDSASSLLTLNGNAVFSQNLSTTTQNLDFGGAGNISFNGNTTNANTGNSTINKYGTGTLSFSGAAQTLNSYGTIYNGTVSVGSTTAYATGLAGNLSIGSDFTSTNAVLQATVTSSSSTPLGNGNITMNQGGTLQINGSGTGTSTITLAAGTSQKITFSSGANTIDLNNGNLTTLTATIGNANLARSTGATVTIGVPSLSSLGVSNQLLIAGTTKESAARDSGNISLPLALPYFIGQNTTTGAADFLTYNATTGFAPLSSYSNNGNTGYTTMSSATALSAATAGQVFLVISSTPAQTQTGNLTALNVGNNTLTLNSGVTMSFGGISSDVFGIIMDGGNIAGPGTVNVNNNSETDIYTTANGGNFSGNFTSNGSGGSYINKFGPGNLTISAPSFVVGAASSGSLIVNQGGVIIGNGSSVSARYSTVYQGSITVQSGGNFSILANGSFNLSNANASLTVNGTFAVPGPLNVTAGIVTINSGGSLLGNATSGNTTTGNITIGSSTTDQYNTGILNPQTYALATLRVNSGASMGTGNVTILGGGTLSLASLDQLTTGNLNLGGASSAYGGLETQNGTTNTTFNRPLTAAVAAGGFQWSNSGNGQGVGFAARGGNLTVNITDTTGNNTLTPGAFGMPANMAFGSPNADHAVNVLNPLNIAATAVFEVTDNPNSVGDYVNFSGNISLAGNATAGQSIQKQGNGLLYLSSPTALTNFIPTGTQTGTTGIRFFDGVLRLPNVSAFPASSKFALSFQPAYVQGNNEFPGTPLPSGAGSPEANRPILETNGNYTPNNGTGNITQSNAYGGGYSAWGPNPAGNASNNLIVNFGGAAASQNWSGQVTGGSTGMFQLTVGSPYTNGTAIFKNPINLNYDGNGIIYVYQGANTGSTPSGEFDGNFGQATGSGVQSITKDGNGTLLITGNSTYIGATTVVNGTLRTSSNKGLSFGGVYALNNTVGQAVVTGVEAATTLDLYGVTVEKPIVLNGSTNGASLINSNTAATAIIDNGLAGIQYSVPGNGTYAGTISVVLSGGGGSGATATATQTGGNITGITTTAAGTGYTSAPTVTINGTTGGNGTATATAILSSVTLNGTNNSIGGAGNLTIKAIIADGTSSGGFTKIGGGTLTLPATNTYSGATTVAAGILNLATGGSLGNTSVTVNAGATFLANAGTSVSTASTATTFALNGGNASGALLSLADGTIGNFTIGGTLSLTGGTITPTVAFDLGNNTTDALNVNSLAFAGGNNTITFNALGNLTGLTYGNFTLIGDATANNVPADWALSAGNITLGNTTYKLNLNNSTASAEILTVAPNGPTTITWNGNNSANWDTSTNNWQNSLLYADTDLIIFDDTAAGNFTINIVGTVNPGNVTVNNSTNAYSIGGGIIGGNASLTKNGTNTLTLTGANTFSGGTTVNAGLLDVATATNGLASGSSVTNYAALQFDGSQALATITGNGTTTITGNGSLAVTSFTQSNLVNNGAIALSGTGTISTAISGAGNTTVSSTGALTTSAFAQTALVNNGTVQINGTGTIGQLTGAGNLTIGTGSSNNTVQLTQNVLPNSFLHTQQTLTISSGSTLDITNNQLLLNYGSGSTPLAAVQAAVASGAITSSTATGGLPGQFAVGFADSTEIGSIPSNNVEVMFTLAGDANLDGMVNFNDYSSLQNSFNQTGRDWSQGDFNHDGTANFNDYSILQNNYGQTLAGIVSGSAIIKGAKSLIQTSGSSTIVGAALAANGLTKLSSSIAPATTPTVTYILSVNDDGTGHYSAGHYAVYASDSTNNGGLASYDVSLGGTKTLTNYSPKGNYDDGSGCGTDDEMGFVGLRSANNASPATGTQDTAGYAGGSGVILVYGFGQTAGNLGTKTNPGSTGADGSTTQAVYGTPLELIKGSFSSGTPSFTSTGTDTGNVFLTTTGYGTEAPTLTFSTVTLPSGVAHSALLTITASGSASPSYIGTSNPGGQTSSSTITVVNTGVGYYIPGLLNGINAGNATRGAAKISGFSGTDAEIIAVAISVTDAGNGTLHTPSAQELADIITDLNASPSLPGGATVTVEAYNGTTAGTLQHDNLAAFILLNTFETNYGGQALELAVLVSGVTPPGTETFGLNFASESVDGITAVDVTDIAVVPEPASMSLLLLGGLPLISRRRRRHS